MNWLVYSRLWHSRRPGQCEMVLSLCQGRNDALCSQTFQPTRLMWWWPSGRVPRRWWSAQAHASFRWSLLSGSSRAWLLESARTTTLTPSIAMTTTYELLTPPPQTSHHHHHPSMVSAPTQHQLLFWMCSPVSWRGNSPADLESVHVFSSVVHCDGMRSWRPDPRHALLFREPSCERALRWWWWSMSLMYIVLTCLFLCSNKLWSVSFLPFWCLIHCSHLFSHNWRTRHYFVNIFTIHTTWSNGNCTSCCEIGVTVKGWTSMAVDSEGTLYEIMAHWRSSGVMTTEEHCLYL